MQSAKVQSTSKRFKAATAVELSFAAVTEGKEMQILGGYISK